MMRADAEEKARLRNLFDARKGKRPIDQKWCAVDSGGGLWRVALFSDRFGTRKEIKP